MKFDNLKVGQVLFDVHSYKMGNTTIRSLGVWTVYVKEIDAERRRAFISWNGNAATWWYGDKIAKLKETEPYLVRSGMITRRPTREELAEHRAKVKAAAAPQTA